MSYHIYVEVPKEVPLGQGQQVDKEWTFEFSDNLTELEIQSREYP